MILLNKKDAELLIKCLEKYRKDLIWIIETNEVLNLDYILYKIDTIGKW